LNGIPSEISPINHQHPSTNHLSINYVPKLWSWKALWMIVKSCFSIPL
jgi:hypothetical protein